jgi:hypothetical protein
MVQKLVETGVRCQAVLVAKPDGRNGGNLRQRCRTTLTILIAGINISKPAAPQISSVMLQSSAYVASALKPAVMTDVGDKAVPLMMNDGLVSGSILQVIISHQCHVFSFRTASRGDPGISRYLGASAEAIKSAEARLDLSL